MSLYNLPNNVLMDELWYRLMRAGASNSGLCISSNESTDYLRAKLIMSVLAAKLDGVSPPIQVGTTVMLKKDCVPSYAYDCPKLEANKVYRVCRVWYENKEKGWLLNFKEIEYDKRGYQNNVYKARYRFDMFQIVQTNEGSNR